MAFYIVDGLRGGRIRGQWVILATAEDEATTIAERRAAERGEQYDRFQAERAVDAGFDAEENLTEAEAE